MAQTYGIMANGKYWHVNTVVDMIELGMDYKDLPENHKKGNKYEDLVYDVDDGLEYLRDIRGVHDPSKLLQTDLIGVFEYSGFSQTEHWDYYHRKRSSGTKIEEDSRYPSSTCKECIKQAKFDKLWHGDD